MVKGKRPAYETFIIVTVVGLSLLLGVGLYAARSNVIKSRTLINELSSLRAGIALYKMVNRSNPQDLKTLLESTYEASGVTRPYVEHIPIGKDGVVIDPFGSPYAYDTGTGSVSSQTSSYERW